MAFDKNGKKLPKGIWPHEQGYYLGRFQYLGERYEVYDKDLKQCCKKLEDLRYEVRHGSYTRKENMTVDQWFHIWLEEYKELQIKEGSKLVYSDAYRLYIKPKIGKVKLQAVQGEHIQKIYNDLKRKNYSNSTIDIVATVLSGMFKRAYLNKRITDNPVKMASPEFKKEEEKEMRVMSKGEQKLFMEYAKNSWLYPLIVVALYTGMRSGELRGLTWDKVDFDKRWITVNKSLLYLNKQYVLGATKTKSSVRKIPMLDEVYHVLKKNKKEQLEKRLLLGDMWKEKEGMENLVFPSDTGYPMNRDRLKVQVNKIIKNINEAGYEFEHITPHTFRHTFSTICIENGMQPKVLQKILGHSKLSQTMDLYVHTEDDFKVEEMKKIANLF